MQWSDETVERLKEAIFPFIYTATMGGVVSSGDAAKAALAAVAECKEVRELVEATKEAREYMDRMGCHTSYQYIEDIDASLAPFTEGK